jgi:hypothetical protein
MPGVSVRTATRSGPVNSIVPPSGRYFVAGQFERGLTGVPVRVRSLAEVEVMLGGRVTYGSAYDDLRMFFEEGGTEAWAVRVVGPAATKGTLTLTDKAGSPLPTVRIDAISAGAWSASVSITSAAGTVAGTYKLTVAGPLGVVETYDNLATPADAVTALNASAYVRAFDLGSATVGPLNNQPKVQAATALSAGTDDRASITATTMGNALAAFGSNLGTGAVAIPGYPSSLVGAALMAHAKTFRRLALMAAAVGADDAAYTAAAAALLSTDGEYGGLFGPHVRVPLGGGASKLISPEGYVAAVRGRAHRDVGPWRAPAGEQSQANFIIGIERELTQAQGNALNASSVSVIRTIAGTTRLYGWRSLSTDVDNYQLLTGRDVLNVLAYSCEDALERYVFHPIDAKGQLLASIHGELIGVVEPMRVAGGLYELVIDGTVIDPGYSVDVGPTVNTAAVLNANKVAAVLAVRVSPVGELIDLTIVKAGLTATV